MPEQRGDGGYGTEYAVCVKEHKAHRNHQQDIGVLDDMGFSQRTAVPQLFHGQQHCKQQSPQNKCPCGAVPQPRQQPDH